VRPSLFRPPDSGRTGDRNRDTAVAAAQGREAVAARDKEVAAARDREVAAARDREVAAVRDLVDRTFISPHFFRVNTTTFAVFPPF
jgi:hypothetical protein